MNYTLITIAAVLLILALAYISAYNKLKKRKNQIENAFSVLDALFIKRNDLIPNLIATVKQYMEFEQDVLEKITRLRTPSRNSDEYQRDGEVEKL